MRILYVGEQRGQMLAMQRTLERLGHELWVADPYRIIRVSTSVGRWSFHTGALFLESAILRSLKRQTEAMPDVDLVFVDNGELVGPAAVRYFKSRARRIILFNRDNPFVARDGRRWRLMLQALPEYDLYVTPRETTALRAGINGARQVLQVNFFADETIHVPREPTETELARYGSPVSFVGTWFPERGPFMQTLLDRGVPLRIFGHKWDRADNWERLRPNVTLGYLSPAEYCGAVLSCNIAIAMLSKGNEDVATSRSMEIPGMAKLLCAERTDEHMRLYREGEEAVFWSSPEECADICLELLGDPDRIVSIATAGRRAALRNGNWSEPILQRIVNTAMAL